MNRRCIALEVAQGGLRSQRTLRGRRSLLGILAWGALLLGCPADDPAPSPPPAADNETAVGPAAPVLEKMTLPAVAITDEHSGAKAHPPQAPPRLRANLEGVWLDGRRIIELHCASGDACPGWRDEAGWAVLETLPATSRPESMAVDARVAADVFAALVAAMATGDKATTFLVQSADDSLHALPVGSFPREHGLLDPSSLSYRTTFFRGDLRARRESVQPPPAPGQPIRIRGGAIRVEDRCGGVHAARLIRRNMRTWSACYRMAHERKPGIAGDVRLGFAIPADGIPTSVTATSTNLEDPALFRCLEAGVQEVKFPPQSPVGEPCPVTWDLHLESRKDMPPPPPERPGRNIPIAVLITPEGAQLMAIHGVPALQTGLNAGLGEGLKKRTGIGDRVVLLASPSIPTGALGRAVAEALRAGFQDVRLATPSAPTP